ncbi:MAG: CopG family antitoxin [Thermomicrobiales bacterium]
MTKPSFDFGYPTEAHGRIPSFADIEEEATFWDTHDLAEFYGVELLPVEKTDNPALKNRLTLRLDPADREDLAKRARAIGVDVATLASTWLKERLRQESAVTAGRG